MSFLVSVSVPWVEKKLLLISFTQEAELLISKKIHPQTIIAGWRAATKASREALLKAAVDHGLVMYIWLTLY